jgi:hypothetical protein
MDRDYGIGVRDWGLGILNFECGVRSKFDVPEVRFVRSKNVPKIYV